MSDLNSGENNGRSGKMRFLKAGALGLGALVLALGSLTGIAGATSRHDARSSIGQATVLPRGATRLGVVSPTTSLAITVALASKDPSGLALATTRIADPKDPLFRHFLSTEEFRSQFGPTPEVRQQVVGWLRSEGITVTNSSSTFLIDAVGSVAAIQRAFATSLASWRLSTGRVVHSAARTPSLPGDLRSSVTAVVGLSNVVQLHHGAHSSGAAPLTRGTAPSSACAEAAGVPGGHTAGEVAAMYGFNTLYGAGYDGTGITVALYELAAFDQTDISTYTTCYGLSDSGINVIPFNGGSTIADSPDGVGEITSDIEVVRGMAPGAQINVYETNQTSPGNYLGEYQKIADDNSAQVVSTSWGVCEAVYMSDRSEIDAEAATFSQMALQGQSVVAASGDDGSSSCAASGYSNIIADDPGTQPGVLDVGGTNVTTVATPPVEEVWNQSGLAGDGAGWPVAAIGNVHNSTSSGGVSIFWPMPTYQQGADRSGLSTGTPCSAPTGYCREVPDVSAMAEDYPIYGTAGGFAGAGWVSIGGTSLAAPLWGSLLAIIDQMTTGNRLGSVNTSLYQLARQVPSSMGDVTVGTNNMFTWPTNYACTYQGQANQPCFRATQGFDMATGLGSPRAVLLANLLSSQGPTITSSSLSSTRVLKWTSAPVTVFGGTGSLHFAVISGAVPDGMSLNTSTGVISGRPPRSGTAHFTVRVTDSATPTPRTDTASLSLHVRTSPQLDSGSVLRTGSTLVSAAGGARLSMSTNGVVSLTRVADGSTTFATPSAGPGAGLSISSGSLVLRRSDGSVAWSSPVGAQNAKNAAIDDTGLLVLFTDYGALWSSNFGVLAPVSLPPGAVIPANQPVSSRYGAFTLELSPTGVLGVSQASNGAVRWSVTVAGAKKLVVQTDGNVVLKAANGAPLWSTETAGSGVNALQLTNSGTLQVISPSGQVRWRRP